jgi:hypothetical protein
MPAVCFKKKFILNILDLFPQFLQTQGTALDPSQNFKYYLRENNKPYEGINRAVPWNFFCVFSFFDEMVEFSSTFFSFVHYSFLMSSQANCA